MARAVRARMQVVPCNHRRMNTRTSRLLLLGVGAALVGVPFDMTIAFVVGSETCCKETLPWRR